MAIAIISPQSAPLATEYGASGTAFYTSPGCAESARALAAAVPIRHALDCIVSAESSATCFSALARTGGRNACVEKSLEGVRVKEVMGYDGLGRDTQLGSEDITNPNPRQCELDVHAQGGLSACRSVRALGL